MIRNDTPKAKLWKARLNEQRVSGLSIGNWCRQNQISKNTFAYWKYRLVPLKRSSFLELFPKEETNRMTLEWEKFRIVLEKNFCEASLIKLLRAFRKVSC